MKSHWMILILSAILGIIVIGEIGGTDGYLTAVFKDEEESIAFPALMAPGRQIREVEEGQRVCYLTFDDGPSENTEKVLDLLQKYEVKATFFVVGEELTEARKEILKRAVEEGHAIGMHANRHVYKSLYESMESFLKDYETLYQKLKNEYGIETALFRFPGGSVCDCLNGQGKQYLKEMEERGFSCFDWNVSGEDAVGSPTVSSIQKKVLSRGLECRRAIVLLHDSAMAGKTVEALPGIIERFKEEGFIFDSLENAENYIFPASR